MKVQSTSTYLLGVRVLAACQLGCRGLIILIDDSPRKNIVSSGCIALRYKYISYEHATITDIIL